MPVHPGRPMKTFLLAVSLLLNAGFVTVFALRPTRVPPAFRDYFTFGSGPADAASTGTKRPAGAPVGKAATAHAKLWATLSSDDLATLAARLRAAGFPIYTIRAILQNAVNARYAARMRELAQNDPNAPFWKATNSLGMDPKRLAEYMQLANERSRVMRDLLGNYLYHDSGTLSTAEARQYGGLPQAKIDQLERINQDYSELNNQVRAAMNGITLPEDREKLALLEREKRADLAALLTPEELADYDMRNSPVTARLRPTFDLFKVTEDEFRSIYTIQQAYSDRVDLNGTTFGALTPDERSTFMQQRTAAQKELDAQMHAALGDARYAEFVRDGDRDFQQLNRLAEQQNLPAQVAIDAYNLRDGLSQESNRIFNDASLDYDQKRAALQSLAQNTRTQLVATLGPAASATYLRTADRWLTSVERGGAITFTSTGGTSIRGLPNPNAPRPVAGGTSTIIGTAAGGIITSGDGVFYLGGGTTGSGPTIITAPAPVTAPAPTR